MYEELYEKTNISRDKLFESLGHVEPDVISHLINPSFMGGPTWPSLRQAFSIIRTIDSTIVASNGLSDPFQGIDEVNSGFFLEVYAETNEKLPENISESWLFKLVYSIARQAAHSGEFYPYIKKYGVVTMELYAEDDGLEEFQNENGMVGVMIGVENPNSSKYVQFPGGEVLFASIQILTPDELSYVVEHDAEGRKQLHNKLQEHKVNHRINPNRQSLVGALNVTDSPKWKFWRKS
ncbi:hypothetical protein VINI7043_01310 [Vibrio nigripulchritudo ATCC 27043]|uniref:suppressor of fused domain protein n=1 Tax=Vibrio nigripulchritudo TaxID=28173 RepID=UPI00021C37B5|nr:suppressor of fused domain protein [Vibrio nigripulchritudo]EGU60230.1 hypothetical protein VINI7043_01310 [Vibrio nigripulchritudo ATCC 27043]